jgi:hypothetical protein
MKKTMPERIVDCLLEMKEASNSNGNITSIHDYFKTHGTSMALAAVLKERGTIEHVGPGEYIWRNGDPDLIMGQVLDQALKDRVKKQVKEKKDKSSDLVPIDSIIDDLIILVDDAIAFEVPRKNLKTYVKTMFHRQKA